jgi:membrane-bound lytic murein transglycosylase D
MEKKTRMDKIALKLIIASAILFIFVIIPMQIINNHTKPPISTTDTYKIDSTNIRIKLWYNYWKVNIDYSDTSLRSFYYNKVSNVLLTAGLSPDHVPIYAEVPTIECGWNQLLFPDSSSARGLWQITKGRAKELGLKIDKNYDERLDPYRSTLAAANAFLELEKTFDNDPIKVLFAWHGGIGLLTQMQRDFKTDNPWLYQFPNRETYDFAPKVLALTLLMRVKNGNKQIPTTNRPV